MITEMRYARFDPEIPNSGTDMKQRFLCFKLGGEHYLADISTVREIVPYEEPNPVPGTDASNLGMLDIRGNIISVFSGHALLALDTTQTEKPPKIIIFQYGNSEFGVVVDDLDEIVNLDTSKLEHPVESQRSSLILGTITHNGKLLIMIDFASCSTID
jgi:purine-binding chemotaxis protein CheW